MQILASWILETVLFFLFYPLVVWIVPPSWHESTVFKWFWAWAGSAPPKTEADPPDELLRTAAIACCKVAYLSSIAPGKPQALRSANLRAAVAGATLGQSDPTKDAPSLSSPADLKLHDLSGDAAPLVDDPSGERAFWQLLKRLLSNPASYREVWESLMLPERDLVQHEASDATTDAQCIVGQRGGYIVVAFCGSLSAADWMLDFHFSKWQAPPGAQVGSGTVHVGFLIQYLGIRDKLRQAVRAQLDKPAAPGEKGKVLCSSHRCWSRSRERSRCT